MERRFFLTGLAGFTACILNKPGLLLGPANAATSHMPAAFHATDEAEIGRLLFPGMHAQESQNVKLALPYLARPVHTIMVHVNCETEPVQAIAITAENEIRPLAALAVFHQKATSFATRIRLTRTTAIKAYILTGSGLYVASRSVKVTNGGYGTTFN